MKKPIRPKNRGRPWLAHIFPDSRVRHAGICLVLLAMVGGALDSLGAQSTSDSSIHARPRFELLLKRQTFSYLPYEYTSLTEKSAYGSVYEPTVTDPLKGNEKVVVPAAFSCEDCIESWRLEASYYEIELPAPNVLVLRTTPSSLVLTREYLNPSARSEALGTAARRFRFSNGWRLFAGGGIQNINKYTYGTNTLSGSAYREYFFTYGASANARLTGPIHQAVTLALQTKLFYTTGTRFASNVNLTSPTVSVPPGSAVTISSGTARARGIFRGVEGDVSVAYRFMEHFELHIGYDYIYSYFSHLHYRQLNVTFPLSGTPTISYPPRTGNHEIVRGVYAAVSMHFE